MAKFKDCRMFCRGAPMLCSWANTVVIFVNDIDTVISSHIQKCADDCKVYR